LEQTKTVSFKPDTTPFLSRFRRRRDEKRSILSIGLDPALPEQRSADTIPESFVNPDENKTRLDFCIGVIEQTSDYCCAYKVNQQYTIGLSSDDHRMLAKRIQEAGCISILDYKLNDIPSTVDSALFHISRQGYDALTFNPFLGNLANTVKTSRSLPNPLGVIVLALPSNPESSKFVKAAGLKGSPLYRVIAQEVKSCGAEGCVVSAADYVTESDVVAIRKIVGRQTLFLVVGVGAQLGNPRKVVRASGENTLVNVGRRIIYTHDPKAQARTYNTSFNQLLGRQVG